MEVVSDCFFFFSSRRRHTRFDCDWSSDVCSSDLENEDDHEDERFARPATSWTDTQNAQAEQAVVGVEHEEHVVSEIERFEPALNPRDRKSTRLNSSHSQISYAVFCLKKQHT